MSTHLLAPQNHDAHKPSFTPKFLLQSLSIVFVHSLQGHHIDTWSKNNICWPRDLLLREQALSNARILSFGYDSRVVDYFGGQASKSSVFQHAISSLNGLCRERDDTVGFV